MTSKASIIGLLLAAVSLTGLLRAQATVDLTSLQEAAALRSEIAAGVAAGTITPVAALARLKAAESPSGLKLAAGKDADAAFAAIDIGQRLARRGKPVEAGQFFMAAEEALERAAQTVNRQGRDRAMILQKLALIRSRYLGKMDQARTDIREAITLAPENKSMRALLAAIERQQPEHFNDRFKK
jgi:hypothetical protein